MVKRTSSMAFGPLRGGFKKFKGIPIRRRRKLPTVKGALVSRQEKNYVDIALAQYAADSTGTITLLNGIAEGDDNTQRNGRKAKMLSCQINGSGQNVAGNTVPQKIRFLLVWDNAPNGAAPTISQILTTVNSESFPLVDNEDRFTILRDMKIVLGPNVTTATQTYIDMSIAPLDFYRKINSDTKFNGTGATIASIQNGALWGVTVGNNVAGVNAANFQYTSRVRFTDI